MVLAVGVGCPAALLAGGWWAGGLQVRQVKSRSRSLDMGHVKAGHITSHHAHPTSLHNNTDREATCLCSFTAVVR